jgi:hypothetical protein
MSIEKYSDHIRNRTRDFPACNIVPQPTGAIEIQNKICLSLNIWKGE